jgi:curved DNA-binding protein CbpA
MAESKSLDHYETLQISPTAEPDTIHRVYRLLAQRFHPDNRETGDATRFRIICEAYQILSDPESRAQYDAVHEGQQQARWRLIKAGSESENNFDAEQAIRLTVLEVLYTRRRIEPLQPGLFLIELEQLTGTPREHLEFTVWYLMQKEYTSRTDSSRLMITASGVDYLEQNYQTTNGRRLLAARNDQPIMATAS